MSTEKNLKISGLKIIKPVEGQAAPVFSVNSKKREELARTIEEKAQQLRNGEIVDILMVEVFQDGAQRTWATDLASGSYHAMVSGCSWGIHLLNQKRLDAEGGV